jgi:hypothetical protein
MKNGNIQVKNEMPVQLFHLPRVQSQIQECVKIPFFDINA